MPDSAKHINRRQFLKMSVGLAAGIAALSAPLAIARKTLGGNDAVKAVLGSKHAGSDPKKARAWAMVIDLRKCEGCVTLDTPPQCTQACIATHYVPNGEQWVQVYEEEMPGGGKFFMPVPCFQCENAPCVNVCPVAATYRDETGVVLVDHRRCIGCRMCMAACPYDRRFFNWSTPQLPPEAALAEYSPLYPVPAVRGTVIKCMFCAHMLADGKLPVCVTGCPMKALYIGDFNENLASNGVEVVKLNKFLDENNAYRYREELGTQPRVWYLPGYGQGLGRTPEDTRRLKPPQWPWGGEGDNKRPGIQPRRENT